MYFGATGERFRVTAGPGRPAVCPAGTQTEDTGRFPSGGSYANCYRPPSFAPPPTTTVTYHAPTTTVSPAIQAQVSPQISPTLAQQQASPGASVQSSPAQTSSGQAARGGGGMTATELQNILAEQRAADQARRDSEMQAMQQAFTERQQLIDQMNQQASAERERQEAERAAAEAEATQRAIDSAASLPATAGAFVPPSPLQAPVFPGEDAFIKPASTTEITAGTVTAPDDAQPVPYLLLAAAAVGAAFLLRKPKGARKR